MFSHSLSPCSSPLLGVALPNSLSSEDTTDATNRSISTAAFLFGWQSCGSLGCDSLEAPIATTTPGKPQSFLEAWPQQTPLRGCMGSTCPRGTCAAGSLAASSRQAPGNPLEPFWATQSLSATSNIGKQAFFFFSVQVGF